MNPIRLLREIAGLTQQALADAAGTSQPTVAAYEGGTKSPTLDTVRRLTASAGLEAWVEFHPPMTREERRSLALHRAIAARVRADPDQLLARARRTLERMSAAAPGSPPLLREWSVILDRPLPAILAVLTDPDPWARELRHVTPFAGVLTAAERAGLYRDFRREDAVRGS